jgi:hypothetical protein
MTVGHRGQMQYLTPQQHSSTLTKPLLEVLPRSSNGSILITSRNKVALKVLDARDVIEIGPLDKSESLKLPRRKIGTQKPASETTVDAQISDVSQALELVEALDFMPLAITQVAGFPAIPVLRKHGRVSTTLPPYQIRGNATIQRRRSPRKEPYTPKTQVIPGIREKWP